MNRTVLFLALMLMALATKAQDIITLTDGTKITAKVLEINPNDIKYKEFSNQDGPVITILKETVASIRYANGHKDVINAEGSGNRSGGNGGREGYKRNTYSSSGRSERDNGGYKKTRMKPGLMPGWFFGADMTIGVSNASNHDASYTTADATYSGITIFAAKMFNQHYGLQFGLGSANNNYDINSFNYAYDEFSLNYLVIPLRALYFSNSKHRAGLYASAGIDLSILTSAHDLGLNDISSYFNSVLVSPYISAGVEFRNKASRSVWMFGLFYKASLNNCYSGNAGTSGLSDGNTGSMHATGLAITFMHNYSRKYRGAGHARQLD